jgi:alkanesulfonate monooxygenase SsuD/methylene tetrahydromethanopterin reductase-like flavin-dependent oxidoreductase (luciferase family)
MAQHLTLVGTPDAVTKQMETWFSQGACDGFNILPSYSPGSLVEIAEHIVPRLQRRGLFRRSYESSILRENLGLRPV